MQLSLQKGLYLGSGKALPLSPGKLHKMRQLYSLSLRCKKIGGRLSGPLGRRVNNRLKRNACQLLCPSPSLKMALWAKRCIYTLTLEARGTLRRKPMPQKVQPLTH
jgi:hypothetical protein